MPGAIDGARDRCILLQGQPFPPGRVMVEKRPEVAVEFGGHERGGFKRAPTVETVLGEQRACSMGDIGKNGEIFGKDTRGERWAAPTRFLRRGSPARSPPRKRWRRNQRRSRSANRPVIDFIAGVRHGACVPAAAFTSVQSRESGEAAKTSGLFASLAAANFQGTNSTCAQRLLASLTQAGFPRACLPKTVSSTRCQYASMTFAFSADIPPVTCISGPNPESVAVRLTIM